jgi:excisionase family DNA binding protein
MSLAEKSIIPKEDDRSVALETLEKLRRSKIKRGKVIVIDELKFTKNMKEALATMLEKMANGEALTILSTSRDFTPREAAEILRFSRGHLTKLLDNGELRFRMVGTHRRIDAKHLFAYKEKIEREREDIFAEMSKLGQEIESG